MQVTAGMKGDSLARAEPDSEASILEDMWVSDGWMLDSAFRTGLSSRSAGLIAGFGPRALRMKAMTRRLKLGLL